MDEEKKLYYASVKGNNGRWIFPVETEPSSAKAMQDDGIQIELLDRNFVRTDIMKLYGVLVRGKNKTWLLSSLLGPKTVERMRDGGITVDEIVDKAVEKKPKRKSKGKAPK